jgi:hypothetical protein
MKYTILILLLTTILLTGCIQYTPSTIETIPLPTVTTTAATTKIITTTTTEKTDETTEPIETVAAETKVETTAETKAVTTAAETKAETTAKKETAPPETTTEKPKDTDALYIQELFDTEKTDVWVSGKGTVSRLLADDNSGDRHQRFILELSTGQTLLIAHNIDIAPYLEGLEKGDTVSFYGEYYWSDEGGGVHWTHHDPDGSSGGGWLKWNGKTYK